jgi:hypothetical protein
MGLDKRNYFRELPYLELNYDELAALLQWCFCLQRVNTAWHEVSCRRRAVWTFRMYNKVTEISQRHAGDGRSWGRCGGPGARTGACLETDGTGQRPSPSSAWLGAKEQQPRDPRSASAEDAAGQQQTRVGFVRPGTTNRAHTHVSAIASTCGVVWCGVVCRRALSLSFANDDSDR